MWAKVSAALGCVFAHSPSCFVTLNPNQLINQSINHSIRRRSTCSYSLPTLGEINEGFVSWVRRALETKLRPFRWRVNWLNLTSSHLHFEVRTTYCGSFFGAKVAVVEAGESILVERRTQRNLTHNDLSAQRSLAPFCVMNKQYYVMHSTNCIWICIENWSVQIIWTCLMQVPLYLWRHLILLKTFPSGNIGKHSTNKLAAREKRLNKCEEIDGDHFVGVSS